jgi:hypothetical protein
MTFDVHPRADKVVLDGLVTLETAKEQTIKEADGVLTITDEDENSESYLYGRGLFGPMALYKHTHDVTAVCPECGQICRTDFDSGEAVCADECGGIAGRLVMPVTDIDGTHDGSNPMLGPPPSVVPEPDVQ